MIDLWHPALAPLTDVGEINGVTLVGRRDMSPSVDTETDPAHGQDHTPVESPVPASEPADMLTLERL
jgi:hypothetical protein